MVPPHQYFYRDTISRRMPTKANKERLSHKTDVEGFKKVRDFGTGSFKNVLQILSVLETHSSSSVHLFKLLKIIDVRA